MTLGERIRELRERQNMTQAELARKVRDLGGELSQGQLSGIESAPTGRPRCLPELAKALGVPYDELINLVVSPRAGINRNGPVASVVQPEVPPQNVLLPGAPPERRRTATRTRRLPVWASAEGGQGAWVVHEGPVDWIERPDFLENVVGAFAVQIIGSSMEDRFFHGETLLVNPAKVPKIGDFCLFLREAPEGESPETRAAVKRLVRSTVKSWVVKQSNPVKQFDLPKAEWRKAYVIVGTYTDR